MRDRGRGEILCKSLHEIKTSHSDKYKTCQKILDARNLSVKKRYNEDYETMPHSCEEKHSKLPRRPLHWSIFGMNISFVSLSKS